MASKAKIALVNAFLKLIEEEDFSKITVTRLVESCSISRQTFYYHFDDIDEMLKWAFENETKQICSADNDGIINEGAALYTSFLKRYDKLLRSAADSDDFIKIYTILTESFKTYITDTLNKKNASNNMSEGDRSFLVNCIATSLAGLVVQEIQKEESDYDELLKSVKRGLKILSNK